MDLIKIKIIPNKRNLYLLYCKLFHFVGSIVIALNSKLTKEQETKIKITTIPFAIILIIYWITR